MKLSRSLTKNYKPIVLARKPGKLPGELLESTYSLEYSENSLSIQKESVKGFKKFAIIDDLLATGGTVLASLNLIRKFEGKEIVGAGFVINLPSLGGLKKLESLNINTRFLIEF